MNVGHYHLSITHSRNWIYYAFIWGVILKTQYARIIFILCLNVYDSHIRQVMPFSREACVREIDSFERRIQGCLQRIKVEALRFLFTLVTQVWLAINCWNIANRMTLMCTKYGHNTIRSLCFTDIFTGGILWVTLYLVTVAGCSTLVIIGNGE